MMMLKSLSVERVVWGADKGKLQGKTEFEGESGSVRIALGEADCRRMFAIVADGVVAVSREVAERLTAECTAAVPPGDGLRIA